MTSVRTPTNVYDHAFFEDWAEGSTRSARRVVEELWCLVRPRSVVDVGCGIGAWLSVFRERGVEDILGLDGAYVDPEQLLIPRERFRAIDLSIPFVLDRTFDLAVSVEVAEHLPETSAKSFVESLCRLAPVILFSAAVPYQSGVNHVNEQWPDYWQELFSQRGFRMFDPLRRKLWYDDRVEWWYRQNLFIFVRDDRARSEPLWRDLPEISGEACLMLVHHRVLEQHLKRIKRLEWLLDHPDRSRILKIVGQLPRLVCTALARELRLAVLRERTTSR